jgi:hypothetical protein
MTRTACALFAFLLAHSEVAFSQACTPPSATITFAGSASDGYVCGGQSLTAEVPDAGPGATYEWSLAGDSPEASITSGQGTRTVTVLSKNMPFLGYNNWSSVLRVTVTNACATTSGENTFNAIPLPDFFSVSLNPPPTPIGIGPVGCARAIYSASLVFRGMFIKPPERTYQWQVENGTIVANHGTSIDFQAGAPGTVRWSVVQQDRCSSLGLYPTASGSFLAAEGVVPSPVITAPPSVRPNSTNNAANLSNWQELFLVGPRIYTLDWTVTNGTLQGQSSLPAVFTAGSSGNVTVTAKLVDYCGHTYTPSATIPIGEPAIMLAASDHLCSNEAGVASVTNPVAGATYHWSATGGVVASGQGTPSISFMPMGGSPVIVGVTLNEASAVKSIDVLPVPGTTIATQSAVAPRATRTASIPDAGPGATYSWSISNGSIVGPSNQPEITYVAGDHGSVTLNVSVTSASGCASASETTITIAGDKRRAVRH